MNAHKPSCQSYASRQLKVPRPLGGENNVQISAAYPAGGGKGLKDERLRGLRFGNGLASYTAGRT